MGGEERERSVVRMRSVLGQKLAPEQVYPHDTQGKMRETQRISQKIWSRRKLAAIFGVRGGCIILVSSSSANR